MPWSELNMQRGSETEKQKLRQQDTYGCRDTRTVAVRETESRDETQVLDIETTRGRNNNTENSGHKERETDKNR